MPDQRTVVARFLDLDHGGIVEIVYVTSSSAPYYNARWWAGDFKTRMQVGAGSAISNTAEGTLHYLRTQWSSNLTPINNLGDYPLFRSVGGTIAVLAQTATDTPIAARDVPRGATLLLSAVNFFRSWLGADAVDKHHRLIRTRPV